MSAYVQNENSVKSYCIPLEKMREAQPKEKDVSLPEKDVRPYLEPYHTHFLLVDNGTEGKFDTELPLRAKLEAHIIPNSVPLI